LPPTTFFETNAFDEDNVDKEDLESILDDCLALSMRRGLEKVLENEKAVRKEERIKLKKQ
jgi:hypothetical protein